MAYKKIPNVIISFTGTGLTLRSPCKSTLRSGSRTRGWTAWNVERAANYLDPILKGVHLGLYAMMQGTKLEMEELWGGLIFFDNHL